jgi:hypothetical protein
MIRYVIIGVVILAIVPLAWFAWWLLGPLVTSTEVNEEFPLATRAAIPGNMTMVEVEAVMAAASKLEREVSEEMPDAPAAGSGEDTAQSELTGGFQDADSFHKGSGTATIYKLGTDGQRVLRLEDFRVTNGPDLRVLLANTSDPESHSDLADAGYVELGKLKGNVGSQNYEIPEEVSLTDVQSVVIYCNPFRVVFSVASLVASES